MGVVATALWQWMAGDAFGLAKPIGEDVWQMIATGVLSG